MWMEMEKGIVMEVGWHGKCAEVDALNQLLYSLEKKYGKLNIDKVKQLLEGNTISKAFDVNKDVNIHGGFKKACDSCNPMLKHFKIIEDLTELKK